MKLKELKPEWRENPPGNRYLSFNCPTCPPNKKHPCIITVAVGNTVFPQNTWALDSAPDFDILTISPSLAHQCQTNPHFFIRGGSIEFA